VSGSVYIIGQSFGVTWRVSMAQVFPQTRLTAASAFEAVLEEEAAEDEETAEIVNVTPAQESQAVEVPVVESAVEAPAPGRKRRVAAPV